MAIGLRRKVRLDSRREQQRTTRLANGSRKRKERQRRAARMQAIIEGMGFGGQFPPAVASWIAQELGKPASKASQEELQALCQR